MENFKTILSIFGDYIFLLKSCDYFAQLTKIEKRVQKYTFFVFQMG